MGIVTLSVETLDQHRVLVAFIVLLSYPIYNSLYNIYFHPLSHHPGPKLWAASRIPFIYSLLTGQLIQRTKEFHEKYGDFLRLAPDEVSFASEQAWNEIYAFRPGHKRALRDKAYYVAPESNVDNIITTTDFKFHARVRRILSSSFSEGSLRAQYSLINSKADLLVSQIQRLTASSKEGARVNMTDWLNFFTMDVISDLAFGESFGCLERGDYHEWVHTLFAFLKYMSLAAAPRYYPTVEFILKMFMPKSVMEGQRKHMAYAREKITRRIDLKSERPDFMTPFMKNNVNFESVSREEIVETFNFVIIGGSETTATAMTGIFNHLTRKENKHVLEMSTREIRDKFSEKEEITFDTIQCLPYLDAVINEGLRMCNPVPGGLPRVVPAGGDTYCGTRLAVRTFAVNRSDKLFENPNTFIPGRWLPDDQRPKEYSQDNLAASKPFSVGFHSCLGRPLAWLEMRLVIVKLLLAFDLAVDNGDMVNFDHFPVIMLIQKLPMRIRVRNRN
ncbi:Cytochrome P450 [Glarea lozoyensis ATCC 20868]|uniref:Cytochrome P450 n=1 Tax=Glarea lozoyensis (strain ATCC 20868 / MF5171) TaxID=1116229 RepID=S3D0A9_GLAL2|nr:Cytochrome P450 [Glarea lozoyensis ATCC 20868]EPE30604.1 Cytochrome P450 [Glarea lozoyensis ATCC 20868]